MALRCIGVHLEGEMKGDSISWWNVVKWQLVMVMEKATPANDRERLNQLLAECSDEEIQQLLEICKRVLATLRSEDVKAIAKRK